MYYLDNLKIYFSPSSHLLALLWLASVGFKDFSDVFLLNSL